MILKLEKYKLCDWILIVRAMAAPSFAVNSQSWPLDEAGYEGFVEIGKVRFSLGARVRSRGPHSRCSAAAEALWTFSLRFRSLF